SLGAGGGALLRGRALLALGAERGERRARVVLEALDALVERGRVLGGRAHALFERREPLLERRLLRTVRGGAFHLLLEARHAPLEPGLLLRQSAEPLVDIGDPIGERALGTE